MTVSNANCVEASLSRSKRDQGPYRWMPPNADYHCQYVTDWEAIKRRWGLNMSVRDGEAVVAIKTDCSYLYLQTRKMRGDHRTVLLLDGLLTRFTDYPPRPLVLPWALLFRMG